MKFKILIILSFVLSIFISSCSKSDVTVIGNWAFKGYLESVGRSEGTSFAIKDFGYWGMGTYDSEHFLTDFWKYDPTKNTWSIADSFPGTPRAYNISISNGVKGYVGLGYDGNKDLNDFWEYDPSTDKWTKLPDFPGIARRKATAFAIGTDIFVGTGYDSKNKIYLNDFYKFSNGGWTKITSLTGEKRHSTSSIGFKGKGYIVSGFHNTSLNDFWEYDPTTNLWTQLSKLSDIDNGGNATLPRWNASIFASESMIYLVGGTSSGTPLASCFEWNPTSKVWTEKTGIETSAREGAGCFVINNSGYLIGGRSGGLYLDDCIVFQPTSEKDSND